MAPSARPMEPIAPTALVREQVAWVGKTADDGLTADLGSKSTPLNTQPAGGRCQTRHFLSDSQTAVRCYTTELRYNARPLIVAMPDDASAVAALRTGLPLSLH